MTIPPPTPSSPERTPPAMPDRDEAGREPEDRPAASGGGRRRFVGRARHAVNGHDISDLRIQLTSEMDTN